VTSLKNSVLALKDTNVKANGLSAVTDQFTKIQGELKTVKSDAHGQFSTQINALSTASSSLGSSLTAAKDNLNGGTLTSVASSIGAVVTAGNNLVSAVSSTC
jgi:capsule polysaccharide export protein KpsE/RkpR